MKSPTFDTMKNIFPLLMLSVMTLFINVSFAGDSPGKVANESAIVLNDDAPVTVITASEFSAVYLLKLEACPSDFLTLEVTADVFTPLKIDAAGVKPSPSFFMLARSNC